MTLKRARIRETVEGYLFLLPSLIVLGIFVFWPIGFSFVLSFFKWDFRNMKSPSFALFQNYIDIFSFTQNPEYPFLPSLFITLIIASISTLLIYSLISIIKKKEKTIMITNLAFILISLTLLLTMNISNILIYVLGILGVLLSYVNLRKYRDYTIQHFWSILFLFIMLFVILHTYLPVETDFFKWLFDAKEKNDFLKALYNTGYYVILTVPITLALSLGIALLLNANVKFRAFFRTSYFIPFVTSVVAISLVWQWIFNDEYGLLNYFLSFFNVQKIAWLKDERWTIPTVAIVSIWKTVGYNAVIFLAGLQNIDKFYYEAAEVDGATTFQKFMYITWPLLSPTTFFLTIVSFIGAFKVFAQVFVLYQGLPGPYNKSGLTMVYYVFDLFYNQQRMGLACAAAYLLFGIILIFTAIQFVVGRRMVEYVS